MCVFCEAVRCSFTTPQQATGTGGAVTVSATGTVVPTIADASALPLPSIWPTSTLTFGFPSSPNDYEPGSAPANETQQFQRLSAGGEDMVRTALSTWADVTPLTFVERTGAAAGNADLRIAGTGATTTAWAYPPGWNNPAEGDVWIGTHMSYNALFLRGSQDFMGSYEYYVAMHEFGHALGLKHPHQTYGSATTIMSPAVDGIEFTVMSYRSYPGGPLGALTPKDGHFPQSLMMLDLVAIQGLYGANYTTLSGQTVYRFDPGTGQMWVNGQATDPTVKNVVFRTLWDGGGSDTIDLSAYSTDVTADLNPGSGILFDTGGNGQRAHLATSSGTAIYAQYNIYMSLLHQGDTRSLIENITTGSGDDIIVGNAADNVIDAGTGDNVIDGRAGADTVVIAADTAAVQARLDTSGSLILSFANGTVNLSAVEQVALADASHSVQTIITALQALGGSGNVNLQTLLTPSTPTPPTPPTPPTTSDALAQSFIDLGYPVLSGTSGRDSLQTSATPSVLLGLDGNDRLWAGYGGDILSGGNGADSFVFDLRKPGTGDIDLVTDLDFASGDWLRIVTSITDLFDPTLSSTNSNASTLKITSLQDLSNAVAGPAVSVTDGTHGIVLSLPGVPGGAQLEIAGIWSADIVTPPPVVVVPGTTLVDTLLQSGWTEIQGTSGNDRMNLTGDNLVLTGLAGDDRLWAGNGSNQALSGGSGADRFTLDLRKDASPSTALITDLDFASGDWLRLMVGTPGVFSDDALTWNNLWVGNAGNVAHVEDIADLTEVVASGAVSAVDGTYGMVLTVDAIAPDRSVELAGIWLNDLLA